MSVKKIYKNTTKFIKIKIWKNIVAFFHKKRVQFSIFTFLAFIAPSVLYSLFYENYRIRVFDPLFLGSFITLSVAMSFSKKWLSIPVFIMFCIMELIQFGHIFYFGTPITPFELELLWKERGEITESGLDTFPQCLIFIFCVLTPYIAIIWAYLKKLNKKGSYIATILTIWILSILPRRAYRGGATVINNLMPRNDMVSIYNSMNAFSACIFNRMLHSFGQNTKLVEYKPYTAKKISTPENVNIVVIVGESINPKRMSLYGHSRNTTPYLNVLAKNNKNFIHKLGFSSSVLTTVATTMFFNVQREPNNMMHTAKQPTHLFKLAKDNGFTTAYISAQNSLITRGMAPNYVDIWHVRELAPLLEEKRGDFVILDMLEKYKPRFSDKNFIVLHQRSPHSPYHLRYKNYPQFDKWHTKNASRDENTRDTYDNAMLFTDYFLNETIEYFKKNSKRPTYIIWLPDHSELMGENGIWGHIIVNLEVSKIPFFVMTLNTKDTSFLNKFKDIFQPTHYEIAKLVAELLGYKIINPNEKAGIFYVNGSVITGDAGWFELDKSNGKEVKTKFHNPS